METQGLKTILDLSKGKKYIITNNIKYDLVTGAIGTSEDDIILANNHLHL